jgi:regulator of nucleoside diphosphate kinase
VWKRPGYTFTTKDFDVLQRLLEAHKDESEPMTWLLRHKLEAPHVVGRENLPENIVTLNSRVSVQIGNGPPEMRILSRDLTSGPVGLLLPVTTLRGLALIGLAEGQTAVISRSPLLAEIVRVTALHYQPERAERMRKAAEARPMLRVLEGGKAAGRALSAGSRRHANGDEPGPSAA